MAIIGIVCVDNKWAIGKDNGLLFHLPTDMKFFKDHTMKHTVCMGENTLLSLPGSRPLKDRTNIVLCPEGHEYEGCICIHSFDDFITKVTELSATSNVFIIGGGMLYNSMLPYYDRVLVTKVEADGNGTVFFPNLDENSEFKLISETPSIEDSGYKLKFTLYAKNNSVTEDNSNMQFIG